MLKPEPVWEVFEPRGGRTVGYARGAHYDTAIKAVAEIARIDDRHLDALPVPLSKLDTVPSQLPATVL